ncbi:MAG: diphthine--ammonia ligase [Desulfobacterales bacterium]|nr:diphthine--ammonia ligase [Desulfobacterales bacterium]
MKVVSLWSGGKDSCFACYKAMAAGYEIVNLLNMVSTDGLRSVSHGLDAGILSAQAQLMGIPILQKSTSRKAYEQDFKNAVRTSKERGAEGVVCGDIYLQGHKDWIDRVCEEMAVEPIFPLWGMDVREVLIDFYAAGFEAVVVSTKAEILGQEWLGRKIDGSFVSDLDRLDAPVDHCGESGEYHTVVTAGPLFEKRIKIAEGRKILEGDIWYLRITDWQIL